MAPIVSVFLLSGVFVNGIRVVKKREEDQQAQTPTGYNITCIQPGCWCPEGFTKREGTTTCVQTTIPTFACIQPGCTCPWGFTLNTATRMCVQQANGGPAPPAPTPTPPPPSAPAPSSPAAPPSAPAPSSTCRNVAGAYTRGPAESDRVRITQSGCSGSIELEIDGEPASFEFTVSGAAISLPSVGLTGEISGAGPPYTITWSNDAVYTPVQGLPPPSAPAPSSPCRNVAGAYTRGPEESDWVRITQSGCSGTIELDMGNFEFTVSGASISLPSVGITGEISGAGPPYTITWSNDAVYTPVPGGRSLAASPSKVAVPISLLVIAFWSLC